MLGHILIWSRTTEPTLVDFEGYLQIGVYIRLTNENTRSPSLVHIFSKSKLCYLLCSHPFGCVWLRFKIIKLS